MAAKKPNKAMDFIVAQLKRNPKIAYADLKERAAKKRLKIYPIMYGRAQLLLGIVKGSPRGTAKKKTATKRGPGRPRKTTGRRPGRPRKLSTPLSAVQDLVSNLENHVRENADLRDTLVKIRTLIDRVL